MGGGFIRAVIRPTPGQRPRSRWAKEDAPLDITTASTFNVAQDNPTVSAEKSKRELGWDPAFWLAPSGDSR
jgi:hypothetical protein